MKKLLFLLMVMVFTVACSKTEPENPTPEPKPENTESITLASGTDSAPVVSSEGDSIIVSFTASTAWSASMINSNADSWCSVSPASGNAGSSNITITIKPNDTPDNRSASVVIKAGTASQTIKIEQKQKDALIITACSFEVPAEGGEIKVVAKSNISFTHTISSDAQSWIKSIKTKALKDSILTFEIVTNDALEGRSGKIFLSGGNLKDTINVFQAGDVPKIIITQKEYVLKSEGESFEVEVASNVNATMRMVYPQDTDAWITENATKAISTNKFHFIAQANEDYDPRTALLIFANTENNLVDTVTVTQAQRDAIVLANSEYEFGIDGGKMDFEILANVDVAVTIPDSCSSWIKQVTTRGLESKTLMFKIAAAGKESRRGVVVLSGGNVSQTIYVKQEGWDKILQKERNALIDLYNATDGDNWTNNANWCSDKPVSEWYGVNVRSNGTVRYINIPNNNLRGSLPASTGDFEYMYYLNLNNNHLSGLLPDNIGNLKDLEHLYLADNQLTGQIPESLGNLEKIKQIQLFNNHLEGVIPEGVLTAKWFADLWYGIIYGNKYDKSILPVPAPKFTEVRTVKGGTISDDIYSKNKLTVMLGLTTHSSSNSREFVSILKELDDFYRAYGLNIVLHSSQADSDVEMFMQEIGLQWDAFSEIANEDKFLYDNWSSIINVVDNTGKIIFTTFFDKSDLLFPLVENYLGVKYKPYESTDFSADGKVEILQKATVGKGIDVVLMGDAFSDRDIADGTYGKTMYTAYEKFFIEEPYKTFKNCFNVYSVKAVSKNEGYGDNRETCFSCYFGEGTYVGGDNEKVKKYALKAIPESSMDNAVVIVIMNSEKYAGTCHMYYNKDNDWGSGLSISYFPKGYSDDRLGQVLNHEANGHGFAKLGDEYGYETSGRIPEEEIKRIQIMGTYGWWKNVDFTNDPAQVKWKNFLKDARYAYEGLGVFEGGFTYWRGVWKSTETSIMVSNVDGFNAPSREAIYYRINKLANGPGWKYDYEKFVEYDAVNRNKQKTKSPLVLTSEEYIPLHPPVVIEGSWKNGIK